MVAFVCNSSSRSSQSNSPHEHTYTNVPLVNGERIRPGVIQSAGRWAGLEYEMRSVFGQATDQQRLLLIYSNVFIRNAHCCPKHARPHQMVFRCNQWAHFNCSSIYARRAPMLVSTQLAIPFPWHRQSDTPQSRTLPRAPINSFVHFSIEKRSEITAIIFSENSNISLKKVHSHFLFNIIYFGVNLIKFMQCSFFQTV